ncbi:unnamed protein product [Durusdinium trenchii]|uniref:Uncharacterized protein n=1 Tax=Durusdinium trenchii TaxID=1381693 RepID=A0ABP0S7B9_9DINO
MPVVPKKRLTNYMAKRRRLMWYLDHYRFLYKIRREHYFQRQLQEPLYVQDYKTPEFRFPGFWPGKFGFHPSQDQLEPSTETVPLLESGGDGSGSRGRQLRLMGHKRSESE